VFLLRCSAESLYSQVETVSTKAYKLFDCTLILSPFRSSPTFTHSRYFGNTLAGWLLCYHLATFARVYSRITFSQEETPGNSLPQCQSPGDWPNGAVSYFQPREKNRRERSACAPLFSGEFPSPIPSLRDPLFLFIFSGIQLSSKWLIYSSFSAIPWSVGRADSCPARPIIFRLR